MKIYLSQAKSALNKSKLSNGGYTLNPYSGCPHGCQYCYNQRFFNIIHPEKPWGTVLEIKTNLPEILNKEVKTKPRASVFLSTITDPYNPQEKQHKITRQCLEILLTNNWPVSVLTKSDLILRDLDLFKNYLKNLEVGFTVTVLDNKIAKILEPGAPVPSRRIAALQKLHQNKIFTYVFVAPILPQITDLEKIIASTYKFADEIWFDSLNTKLIKWPQFLAIIKNNFSNQWPFYQKFLTSDQKKYEAELKQQIKNLAEKYKIKIKIMFC